jgi:hypothetical protein
VGSLALHRLPDDIRIDHDPRILERLRRAGGDPESPWTRLRRLLDGIAPRDEP